MNPASAEQQLCVSSFYCDCVDWSLCYLSTSPLWMLVFIFSVKCSTLACGNKLKMWGMLTSRWHLMWRLSQGWAWMPSSGWSGDDMLGTECPKSVTKEGIEPRAVCNWGLLSYLQVSDVKWLLVDVCSIGSSSQPPHTGQVSTVASHGLNDEHASLGPTGRLLDAVTSLTHAV